VCEQAERVRRLAIGRKGIRHERRELARGDEADDSNAAALGADGVEGRSDTRARP
jgi:hypothetical protein